MCRLYDGKRYDRIEGFRVMIDIRDVAAKFLAYRSHTSAEMRTHLKQKGFDEEAIEALI